MNAATQTSLRRLILRKKWGECHFSRSIVSQSFKIQDEWKARLDAPVFQKIKMGEYFFALDKKFGDEYRGSAVDVEIFANNVHTDAQAEHMEELLYKLRRTPHTVHTSACTHHAAVRALLDHGEVANLVKVLDDRMNYGLFLDEYTSILALDEILERGDLKAAARCASQLMLQEETYPLPLALGNLACWRYFSSGREDPWFYPEEIEVDPNPDEVIRVKVKVVPNNYKDDHFDLRDPDKILGKTLIHFNYGKTDTVSRSLLILGHYLYGCESEELKQLIGQGEVADSVLKALASSESEEIKSVIAGATSSEVDVEKELVGRCNQLEEAMGQQLINKQKELYTEWNRERDEELQRQYNLMERGARVEAIKQTKLELERSEQKLFFFDHLDGYEMEKEEKVQAWVRTLPRTDWNMSTYPQNAYYKKRATVDGERKVARWEKRELKKGPPK